MHRTAPRLARILACAAVPVMLVAGCSSDSDSDSGAKSGADAGKSASPTTRSAPTVAPARYAQLPQACESLSKKTVEKLVPAADPKKGKLLPSSGDDQAGSCLWSGLDDEYQYRLLSVSYKRFDSEVTLGSGDQRAEKYATEQVGKAQVADGAKNAETADAAIGDAATTVRTETKKDKEDFRHQTVIARTANVVVTVEYDGAGYEDGKTPDAKKLLGQAEDAAKEAVESVATANKK
ncbi:hypothetical protein IHE55_16560 [Streptomyces pactum]|uniref:DUF3558 domain-containing protein n=1 Tax=Streptomyces pactum TaxID=68249 RepID=A0ABS0NM68_9ACTN|nr:hypothetical protein [Streptomyces pactum]MBH5336299.1 hypothetical protein [Streptomyces pactum]